MKIARCLVVFVLILFVPTLDGRLRNRSNSNRKKRNISWDWLNKTYEESKNDISLSVRALSAKETNNLFLGNGRHLTTMKGYFFSSQPIVPLHISIKNETEYPVVLDEKNLDIGRNFIFFRRRPVNLANIVESLENRWFWSSSEIAESSFIYNNAGRIVGSTTHYRQNPNYLLNCSFLSYPDFGFEDFFKVESSILYDYNFSHRSVIIEAGKTKDILTFLWLTEVGRNFSITLANNKFNVNLYA